MRQGVRRMSPWPKGKHTATWRGGRYVASSGYVMVWKPEHPRANVRGYVYEQILVAEQKVGRPIERWERVHHENAVKTDNRPENLTVKASDRHHLAEHRKPGSARRLPDEPNPDVACGCGCGATFPRYDDDDRPRRFVTGHASKGKRSWVNERVLCACGCGAAFDRRDQSGRPRRFLPGHNAMKGRTP